MGEGSVGKTSIRSKFMGVGFKSEYIKTIGADFASKAIVVKDNKVHFQIWDLAGQKMYRHVRSSFYSGCKCGFLVFDLTQPETLDSLETWVEEAIEHSGGFVKIFIILGNKVDLKDQIKVKQADIDKMVKKINELKDISVAYLTTSAKTGENINEAFEMMGKMFLEKEGFPREGQGSEIDDEILLRHHQEIQPLISVPGARIQTNESDEEIKEKVNLNGLDSDEVQQIISTIMEKINQLSQITLALEERLLLIETKKSSSNATVADINEIRKKIVGLEQQLDKYSIAVDNSSEGKTTAQFPKVDAKSTIPVPTITEIEPTIQDESDEDTSYEVLDRSSLNTMEILDDNEDEASITEILSETEKETQESDIIDETIEAEEVVTKELEKDTKAQTRCPKCGSKLSFIKQYNRWYCYRCKLYV